MNKNGMETDVDKTDVTRKGAKFSKGALVCVCWCACVRVFPINGKGSQGSQAPEGPTVVMSQSQWGEFPNWNIPRKPRI